MKVRSGFVSNSSSSSFLAVGVSRYNNKETWRKIVKAMDLPEGYDWEDEECRKKLNEQGYGAFKLKDGSDIVAYGGYEFFFIGFEAEELFGKDMRLSEIKKSFQNTMKEKYGVKIGLKDITLVCDECSSE